MVTNDGQVTAEGSDQIRSIGEGNGNPLQNSAKKTYMDNYNQCNHNIVPENEPLRLEGTQRVTGEEQSTSTSRHGIDDVAGSKPKGSLATDMSRVEMKVRCCKKLHTVGI